MLRVGVFLALGVCATACGSGGSPSRDDAGPVAIAPVAPPPPVVVIDAAPPPPSPPVPDAGPAAYELAAAEAGEHWPAKRRAAAIAAGVEVIERHECTRCHDIDGIAGVGRPYDCVSCHRFLDALTPDDPRYQSIARNTGKDVLDRYIANIEHYLDVPALTGVSRRVRPEWIEAFLAAPHDVRPVLEVSMIRNRLTRAERKVLTAYFAAIADVPVRTPRDRRKRPSAARLADGRKRYVARGCPACHTLGNVDFGVGITADFLVQMKDATRLAPNLRFARDRLRPGVIVDWIVEPSALLPGTRMPTLGIPREEAELIADFVLFADVGELPAPEPEHAVMELPPAVDRQVSWEEVKERVFGKVCVHCHMNDHEKDTGPGNLGGLGFAGVGLSFRTYERTVWGAARDGKRYSVLQPLPGEKLPRVLQVMLLRRVENRRDLLGPYADRALPPLGSDELLGMPLGLPAMTDEELGILRAWIEQGCVGPAAVTGRSDVTDGFLVPDGPIAVNRGCGLREPADPPPAWASAPGWSKAP